MYNIIQCNICTAVELARTESGKLGTGKMVDGLLLILWTCRILFTYLLIEL